MAEDLRELRYRTKPSIWVPSNTEYVEGLLRWEVDYDAKGARDFIECPVQGCLEEFAALAEATELEILAFTQRRGVLGIMPSVFMQEGSATSLGARHRTSCLVTYEESPRIYARAALIVRHIRATMHFVRTGRKVNAREDELFQRVTKHSPQRIEYKSQAEAHRAIKRVVRAWQRASSLSLGLWASEDDADMTCDFWLDFGTWEQGYEWDAHIGLDYSNDSEKTLDYFFDEVAPSGLSLAFSINRFSIKNATLDAIPFSSGRPSPLFNVLVLQLLQEIALPKDHYFCTRCGTMYPYNEETKKQGASKPRSDRPVSFCKDACRTAQNKEDDSIRHKKKKPTTP